MYEFAGILGTDPYKYSYGELAAMAEARLRQQWIMHGRLNIDLINSQRSRSNQISPIGLYPYFKKPPVVQATKQDELDLAEQLKGSKWLKVTKTTS